MSLSGVVLTMSTQTSSATQAAPATQAERVIQKFGNCRDVSRALALLDDPTQRRTPATIYKWRWPKPAGTGGMVPRSMYQALKQAGRLVGVLITSADLHGEEEEIPIHADERGPKL